MNELFIIEIGPGSLCVQGRRTRLPSPLIYLYHREESIIIQRFPKDIPRRIGLPRCPEFMVIKDKIMIGRLEKDILNPERENVKMISEDEVVNAFKELVKLIEESNDLEAFLKFEYIKNRFISLAN